MEWNEQPGVLVISFFLKKDWVIKRYKKGRKKYLPFLYPKKDDLIYCFIIFLTPFTLLSFWKEIM